MRSLPWCVVAIQVLGTMSARAEKTGGSGGNGGGGALSHVSSGLGRATTAGSNAGSSGASTTPTTVYAEDLRDERCARWRDPTLDGSRWRWSPEYGRCVVIVPAPAGAGVVARAAPEPPAASLDFYAGAQKVHDSDGSLTFELGISDRWFRFAGSLTRYYERLPAQPGGMSGDTLTLTMPTLTGGVRVDDGRKYRVYLEAGLTGAKTQHDPVMDSSIVGALGGVRLETGLSKEVSLIGEARAMVFPDHIRAYSGQVAVRYNHIQAAFRVLDFNVGPALYGPEVGVQF